MTHPDEYGQSEQPPAKARGAKRAGQERARLGQVTCRGDIAVTARNEPPVASAMEDGD